MLIDFIYLFLLFLLGLVFINLIYLFLLFLLGLMLIDGIYLFVTFTSWFNAGLVGSKCKLCLTKNQHLITSSENTQITTK